MEFPELSSAEQAQLHQTRQAIVSAMEQVGGAIPFDRFMELALYAPGAGYYVNGARKFGAEGDFVTAPELSPLFARCLARQAAELLSRSGGSVLEFGAGSGVMAADLLSELERLDALPERYQILELSPDLRARQERLLSARVPWFLERVEWLDALPRAGWNGLVVANEVLDAMPVSRFRRSAQGWEEQQVRPGGEAFVAFWEKLRNPALLSRLEALERRNGVFAEGYVSELNLRMPAWMRAVGDFLSRGALLLIDYGYTEREYYHPERDSGTLICHFRHRAHDDPLLLPGLQDITASVDFSAVAEAGIAAGLTLSGYTTQAHFLIGCGLDSILVEADGDDAGRRIDLLQGAKQLVLPSGMGERFKVIGFSRGIDPSMRGFSLRDLRASL